MDIGARAAAAHVEPYAAGFVAMKTSIPPAPPPRPAVTAIINRPEQHCGQVDTVLWRRTDLYTTPPTAPPSKGALACRDETTSTRPASTTATAHARWRRSWTCSAGGGRG